MAKTMNWIFWGICRHHRFSLYLFIYFFFTFSFFGWQIGSWCWDTTADWFLYIYRQKRSIRMRTHQQCAHQCISHVIFIPLEVKDPFEWMWMRRNIVHRNCFFFLYFFILFFDLRNKCRFKMLRWLWQYKRHINASAFSVISNLMPKRMNSILFWVNK